MGLPGATTPTAIATQPVIPSQPAAAKGLRACIFNGLFDAPVKEGAAADQGAIEASVCDLGTLADGADRQVIEGRTHARGTPSISYWAYTQPHRRLFAADRPLPEILAEVARLGAQLVMQAALEAEVTRAIHALEMGPNRLVTKDDKSPVTGDCHAGICGSRRVKFPPATRP